MAASNYLYHFCNFCPLLTSFNPKNIICEQFSLKFLARIFLMLGSVQRFSRDLLSKHKEERKSADIISSSTIFMHQLCFLDIFNLNQKATRALKLLYKSQQFLEINGWNLLKHIKELSFIHAARFLDLSLARKT